LSAEVNRRDPVNLTREHTTRLTETDVSVRSRLPLTVRMTQTEAVTVTEEVALYERPNVTYTRLGVRRDPKTRLTSMETKTILLRIVTNLDRTYRR
jgi:hypothetical protein